MSEGRGVIGKTPESTVTLNEQARAELEALGLGAAEGHGRQRCGVDLVQGRPLVPKRAIEVPDVQNEAYDDGLPSSFSRGMRVELPGATMLLLSGTASVDEKGDTIHAGNFEAQLRRTFPNLTELLAAEKASRHDIVRTTCYQRDIERDYDRFNEVARCS